ncbi:hypothetical protein SDRG_07300 [Saprolegnia diclina VS20]|uniref:Sfi1 spindle body domain-containing protein n=1 Tax=Saprolegnia diclina (strain VS20) TaxID=1156394 RepID=T0RXL4_SAPDV|nr:hypothetical protein SDRG_07300 [Saprolegnia diclina VS20]EQC35062.1 hypothetical protein SDRG_07300 [Saprolegnia diclina VS20]|eukprot:XP_008611346.1 hypothetical protein SDRG_07300 [Saprolegnia diclina VS20]
MELHMEQLRQIVRRAEKRHGQTQHLSLVQVLEAAALEEHPTSTHRDLHRSLLTLALDPEEDWWKKLSRLASTRPSRRAPARDRTASVDRFSDVLSATAASARTTMTMKTSVDGRRARSTMSVADKMTATRALVAVDAQSYESFRRLSMVFTHWTRYVLEARSRRLAPIQLRCLFRWLDRSLPTADPTAVGSTLASVALTKSLHVSSKRMALFLHADATLRSWVLLKVWRAWLQHARADLHRRVTVQHRFYNARHRRARDLLRLWHRYALCVAPKERCMVTRHGQQTVRLLWRAWKAAMRLRGAGHAHVLHTQQRIFQRWRTYYHQRRLQRARVDADAAMASARRLAQVFRAWKTGTLRQQEAAWRGHQARCRRALCRWRTLCVRSHAFGLVQHTYGLRQLRACVVQWRRYLPRQQAKRLLHARCDHVAHLSMRRRALVMWIEQCRRGRYHRLVLARANDHCADRQMQRTWRAWHQLLHTARRRRFLQTTVAAAFRRCDALYWVARWRVSTAAALETQTVDLRNVQTVRKRRFWRLWKARRFHATVAAVLTSQMTSHTKSCAMVLWRRFVAQRQARHARWMTAWACHHRHLQQRSLRRWHETLRQQQRITRLLATAVQNHMGRTFGTWRASVQYGRRLRKVQALARQRHQENVTRGSWHCWRRRFHHQRCAAAYLRQQNDKLRRQLFAAWVATRHWLRHRLEHLQSRQGTAALRRVWRHWQVSVVKTRERKRRSERVRHQWQVLEGHSAWVAWRQVYMARCAAAAKIKTTIAWWRHHFQKQWFFAWRAVARDARALRQRGQDVARRLLGHAVRRCFEQWLVWRQTQQAKHASRVRATHFCLRRAIDTWHAASTFRRRIHVLKPRAMTWQRQRTLRCNMSHWRLWLDRRRQRASSKQRALVHWTRTSLATVFGEWFTARSLLHLVFGAWDQYVVLRHKCHSFMRLVEERWQTVSLGQAYRAWAVYSRKRSHHRRKYLTALHHWHAGLLGACYAHWQQWINLRRQRHAIFRRWATRQQRRAIGQWSDFALCQSEYAALLAAGDATYDNRLQLRVLRGWQVATQHQLWCKQAITHAVCMQTTRCAARVWQHWAAYSAYRVAKRHEAGMALALYHATLLKSIFRKWQTIGHVLASARLALLATTLRLQMLQQLSCFRAWLAFAHTSLRHRRLLTSYLARERKRRLRRLLRAWHACTSERAHRRQLAATHHQSSQLRRGLDGFEASVLLAKQRQRAESTARRFLVRSVERRLWLNFCKWREFTDRKLRAKHALTFALATQTSSCVQHWHRLAQHQRRRRPHVAAMLAARTTRTTWRVLHLWHRQARLQKAVRRAGIEHRLCALDHVFVAWHAYSAAKRHRCHLADDLVTSRQSMLATRVLTLWAAWAHRRCRARTVVLRPHSLCKAYWQRWCRAYKVATYFAWYRMRRVFHLWAAGTDLRRARRTTTAIADAFAIQRTLAFWHQTTRCAANGRQHLHAARILYETQLRRKLLHAWARQCRRRESWWQDAVAVYAATLRRRHVPSVWAAWQTYYSTKKTRAATAKLAASCCEHVRQKHALSRWGVVAQASRLHASHAATATAHWQCVLSGRVLSAWASHVRDTRRLQQQCIRMGQLLMTRVVAQVVAAWVRFTATRQAKAEKQLVAICHRNRMLQGVLFLDWWQWTTRQRLRRRAATHFARRATSAVFAQWRRCLVLRKTESFRSAKEGRIMRACFEHWQTYSTRARTLRSCRVTIVHQRDRACCSRSFQAWRRWTTLRSLSYGARLAYCERLLSRVLDGWRHHIHVHHAAATVRTQSRLVLGQLALDLPATWDAWQCLFRVRHWHRHATYGVVWTGWRVYAVDHKRLQTHSIAIARRAARSLQARALQAWHLHAHHVVLLRRALVAKRQRDHVLTMHLRQRGRQHRQAAFTLWRNAVLAARSFFHCRQRQRNVRIIAVVLAAWRHRSTMARRVREMLRHMASWRTQRAVQVWHQRLIARAHMRVVLSVVDRWRRDQTLHKVWPRWATAASRQKRLRRFSLVREQKVWHEAVRRWQYNIHIIQLATKSRLYARLRLLSKRFGQWRHKANWLKCVRTFTIRVTSQTWRSAYVRHWRLHTQRAAIERSACDYMAQLRCRQALRAWTARKADAVQYRRATRCHLRHLWRRWRSVALDNRASWWYQQTLMRASMTFWRTFCIHEQSVRYHHAVASRRRLKDAWAKWRDYQWKRLATAQARAFARFRRLQTGLDAWLLGIETQAAETTAMEAAATALYAAQLRRQHFRGWSHAIVRTKAQRQRQKAMVHTWLTQRQQRHLNLVWCAWARVSRRHRVLDQHRAMKHTSVTQAAWQHWLRHVEHQRVRAKQVHSAQALWRDILLRRTLHHWHISVVAGRAENLTL